MNRRLQQFLSAENISQSQFAESIGVARANVSHILSGRNKPGFDFIEKTITAYPALNVEWLIAGKGKMYRSSSIDNQSNTAANQQVIEHPSLKEALPYNAIETVPDEPEEYHSAINNNPDEEAAQSVQTLENNQDYYIPKTAVKKLNSRSPLAQRNETNTFGNAINTPNKQRVITKIIVYYNDNTYQELK